MFSVPLPILWLMPLLQVTNLLFFWLDSVHHWWYDYTLLFPCLFAGLLGGAVYVQGYSRINADFPLELREFAISSAGVADSLGILVADISSLFIQVICFPFHALFLLLRHNLTFHCIHAVKSELYIQSKWHRRCSCWLPYVNIEHTLTVQLVTCIAVKWNTIVDQQATSYNSSPRILPSPINITTCFSIALTSFNSALKSSTFFTNSAG